MRNIRSVILVALTAQAGMMLAGCATRVPLPPVASVPTPARPVVTLAYRGQAQPMLRRIAKQHGMTFAVEGPLPRLPLFVAVDARNVPLTQFCSNVGMQFGQRANLILGPHSIVIQYVGQQ